MLPLIAGDMITILSPSASPSVLSRSGKGPRFPRTPVLGSLNSARYMRQKFKHASLRATRIKRSTNFCFSCSPGDFLKLFLHLESRGVSEYTPWSGVLCGELRDVPQVFYSSRSTLILEFHTESATSNATGFSGTFHFIDRRELPFPRTTLSNVFRQRLPTIRWRARRGER